MVIAGQLVDPASSVADVEFGLVGTWVAMGASVTVGAAEPHAWRSRAARRKCQGKNCEPNYRNIESFLGHLLLQRIIRNRDPN